MTKEELKEAIAYTIVENGQKGITATALANLLNEIVDAAGSGGSGGGGNEVLIDMPSIGMASEQNAAAYAKIAEGAANNVAYTIKCAGSDAGEYISYVATDYMYAEGLVMIGLYISGFYFQLTLASDGTLSIVE